MSRYRVHFEASAAIGVEVEVEASDEDEAATLAQALHDKGALAGVLADVASELLTPSPEETRAFADSRNVAITYVTVEEDENGFEIVDVHQEGVDA